MPEPGLSRREARVVRFIDRWFATAPKVDGSSFVTSGLGQPTMTIQALAFRAERIARLAKTRGI